MASEFSLVPLYLLIKPELKKCSIRAIKVKTCWEVITLKPTQTVSDVKEMTRGLLRGSDIWVKRWTAGFRWCTGDAGRLKSHLGGGDGAAWSVSYATESAKNVFIMRHPVELRLCARTHPSPHMMVMCCFSEEKIPEQIPHTTHTRFTRVPCNGWRRPRGLRKEPKLTRKQNTEVFSKKSGTELSAVCVPLLKNINGMKEKKKGRPTWWVIYIERRTGG